MLRITLLSLVALSTPVAAFSVSATHAVRPATARAHSISMAVVKQVTTAEFEAEIQDCSTPILVDVYATW